MTTEKIIVKVEVNDNRNSLVRLDIGDELEKIREILEEDEIIKMDNKLLFSNPTDSTYVKREEESRHSLKDIINNNNTLCLKSDIRKNIKNIRVKVKGDNARIPLVRLDIEDKLQRIRKILEKDENIKMDKLLFLNFDSTDFTYVTRNEESDRSLKDIIINNNTLYIKSDTRKIIIVKVKGDNTRSSLVRLDIEDKLQRIRKILEEDEIIKMEDKLLFFNSNPTGSTCVKRKEESDRSLKDIIKDDNSLILDYEKKDYSDLEKRLNLGFGRILNPKEIKIKISKEKLVEKMEIKEIEEESLDRSNDPEYVVDIKSWANKISRFFNSDDGMINYEPNGLSFSDKQNQTEKKYELKKIPKLILKFNHIEPRLDFIEKVKEALNSNNQENFDNIYETFGQFIPTEVVLGGFYYETSSKMISIGGESNKTGWNPDEFNTYKRKWIKSLKRNNWECIEFRNPKSIFRLLNDELREEVNKFFGKKILYKNVKSFKNLCLKYGNKETIKLPLNKFSGIINNEKAGCSVFATVVDEDEEKNDSFNCQIYHPKNGRPQLIIRCFQKQQKRSNLRELKIAFMIVGYDIHFNPNNFNNFNIFNKMQLEVLTNDTFDLKKDISFLGIPVLKELNDDPVIIGHYFSKNATKIKANVFAYNLKKKKYVEKSNFSFHVLTISGEKYMEYDSSEKFSTFSKSIKNPNFDRNIMNLKYVSVCYTSESCGPAFLKQKEKLRKVTCKCKKQKLCILCESATESKNQSPKFTSKFTYSVSNILFTDNTKVKKAFTKVN
ncbi:unnamed protein product [Rhizophagus irregularis]|nr:unnamed protein product [Rhizophagus irregularis]